MTNLSSEQRQQLHELIAEYQINFANETEFIDCIGEILNTDAESKAAVWKRVEDELPGFQRDMKK